MKTIVLNFLFSYLLFIGVFSQNLQAHELSIVPKLQEELSSYISYPGNLMHGDTPSAVVISFHVNDNYRISGVHVFAADKALVKYMEKSLLNKKVKCLQGEAQKEFTIKIKFIPPQL